MASVTHLKVSPHLALVKRICPWTEVMCGDKLRLELTHIGETSP